MRTYSFLFAGGLFLTTIYSEARAQVSQGGTPYSFSKPIHRNVPTVVMPPVNVQQLLAEDEQEQRSGIPMPFRFGYSFEVNLGLTNSGSWDTLSNGDRLWRLKIRCPGAYSINLIYDDFFLPEWATLYIYNEDRSYVIGAFTSYNNKPHGQFSTQPVPGNAIILEYYEPKRVRGFGRIHISNVIHAYRPTFNKRTWRNGHIDNLLGKILDYGESGSCNVNVRCPAYSAWDQQIRSVAMVLTSGGTRICSGALINNERQNLTPYFLTANPCLDGTNPNTWIIMFNYESSGCTSSDGPTNQTVSGTTTVATISASAGTDFALLQLTERPPGRYNTFYAGWSRQSAAPDSVVGIHHPAGEIKKIASDGTSPSSATLGNVSNAYWYVETWDVGTTQGGSSGSPLFNWNHRIVGQDYAGNGYAACHPNKGTYYGKLSVSWDNGSSSSTRLKDWLDPDNSGISVLDGMEGPPTEPTNVTITNPTQIGNSPQLTWSASSSPHGIDYYEIYRCASYYSSCNWSLIGTSSSTSYTDYEIIIEDESSAYDRFSYRVVAVDTRGFSSHPSEIPYANVWGDPIFKLVEENLQPPKNTPSEFLLKQNFPNPFNPSTVISFDLAEAAWVSLAVYDLMGRQVDLLVNEVRQPGSHSLVWQAHGVPTGIYFYQLSTNGNIQTRNMLLIR